MNDRPLIVFALKEESQEVFSDYDVLFTGVGKVNAACALTRALSRRRPPLVINMGTAGSRRHAGGTIVNCTKFIQRDMDVTALGFEKFKTPFSDVPVMIEWGETVPGLPAGVCGTGDNFDLSDGAGEFDAVDMEAYALAYVCRQENIPFLCLKYISDGADEGAKSDWYEALHYTAERLKQALRKAGY
jgi:adenosylhomocysteine nucleosidase